MALSSTRRTRGVKYSLGPSLAGVSTIWPCAEISSIPVGILEAMSGECAAAIAYETWLLGTISLTLRCTVSIGESGNCSSFGFLWSCLVRTSSRSTGCEARWRPSNSNLVSLRGPHGWATTSTTHPRNGNSSRRRFCTGVSNFGALWRTRQGN